MSDRFYVETPIHSDTVQLAGSEAHHLLHVMRAKIGAEVTLFDGTGCEYSARLVRTTRQQADLEVLSRTQIDRELKRELVLGVALPKGDRQSWLVEKAVELGVRRLVPLSTVRRVVTFSSGTLKKLRRAVIESSKQCGRNRLMEIVEPQPLEDYLRHVPPEAIGWFAHPQPAVRSDDETRSPMFGLSPRTSLHVAVGPEGGFVAEEFQLAARAGWVPVCLGRRILRVETAAIALASIAACDNELHSFTPSNEP
jgi:16S rRNA (uracil1498-N3)-methyltransferase